jgi:hypothetical protein
MFSFFGYRIMNTRKCIKDLNYFSLQCRISLEYEHHFGNIRGLSNSTWHFSWHFLAYFSFRPIHPFPHVSFGDNSTNPRVSRYFHFPKYKLFNRVKTAQNRKLYFFKNSKMSHGTLVDPSLPVCYLVTLLQTPPPRVSSIIWMPLKIPL